MQSFVTLGLLDNSRKIELLDWGTFVNQSLMLRYNITDATLPPLSSLIPSEDIQYLHDSLTWLGLAKSSSRLTTSQHEMPPLPKDRMTPLSIFAYLLSQKLKYQPHESDMVVLSHEIVTRISTKTEVHTSTLQVFGHQKPDLSFRGARPASAMARTVGLPLAIASLLVLDGQISLRGVQIPTWPEIYLPILYGLTNVGLVAKETTRTIKSPETEQTVANTLAMTDDTTRVKDVKSRFRRTVGSAEPQLDLEWSVKPHEYDSFLK